MKGSYMLIIEVEKDKVLGIGKLGGIAFKKGYYAYVGSTLGGLEARVMRHKRKEKRLHWHIDHLLLNASVVGAICIESDERLECPLALRLGKTFHSVPSFGCSDCKCPSHLFYSASLPDLINWE